LIQRCQEGVNFASRFFLTMWPTICPPSLIDTERFLQGPGSQLPRVRGPVDLFLGSRRRLILVLCIIRFAG
jgi:hypothetical protein